MAETAQIAVPVGATPVMLNATDSGDRLPGNTLVLFNTGTVTVGLGGSDVSSTNMWRALVAGAYLSIDLAEGELLYGLVPSGGTAGAVDVLRVR